MADRVRDRAGLAAERAALRRDAARGRRLRPARFDDLGLKRAVSDRLLPALVAAMAFLAALALAGFIAAHTLGDRWQRGAQAGLTIQVPRPGSRSGITAADAQASLPNRREAVIALLRASSGIALIHPLSDEALADLLRPWLGSGSEAMTLPLPAVIEVRLAATGADLTGLRAELEQAAPGTMIEDADVWVVRLAALARSLQACTGLALLVVVGVAAAVVAVATRSGLVARRQAIEIVHGLGATNRYIAGRFAARATLLALVGGGIGVLVALPMLLGLAQLAAPFTAVPPDGPAAAAGVTARLATWFGSLPAALWLALPCLPPTTAAIGWLTGQITVRQWLRRLV